MLCIDYYPYGKTLREFVGVDEKFLSTQHERDVETGLDYRGARFYDSDVARFLSLDPLAADYPSLSDYSYVAGNPVMFIDPTGMSVEGDYYSSDGTYLGSDNVKDDKVYIVDGESRFSISYFREGGKYFNNHLEFAEANGVGFSILQLDISHVEFKRLAAVLYAEDAVSADVAAGIYSVLENRARINGTTVSEEAQYDRGVYGANSESIKKINSVNADPEKVKNAYAGLIKGLTHSEDFSNGAYWWDGYDFNGANEAGTGGNKARYKPGYLFTDQSHDLYDQGNNKKSGSTVYGSWEYKYESTKVIGRTTFSKLTLEWRDAQYAGEKMATESGR